MKNRSTDLLQQLLFAPDRSLPAARISKKYAVSLKTLKNDMKEINHFLQTFCDTKVQLDAKNQFFLLGLVDAEFIMEKIFQMDAYMYKFSPEERQIYTIALLTMDPSYLPMEKIAEELCVNRLTISNDLDEIKQLLAPYGMTLISKSGRGIQLRAAEEQWRHLWIQLLKPILLSVRLDGFFQKALLLKLGVAYPLADFIKVIRQFEQEQNCFFAEAVFYEIALYFFVAFNRLRLGYAVKEAPDTLELHQCDKLFQMAAAHVNLSVCCAEQAFFNRYLHQNHLSPISKNADDSELYKILSYFLSEVGRPFQIHFQEDRLLLDALAMHIKTMHKGAMLQVSIEENLQVRFQNILTETEKHIAILEKFLGYQFEKNMVYSIAIHICASMLRNASFLPQISTLIVCPGSMATGKLLEAQIKNYFNFRICGVIAASRIADAPEARQNRIDFILSTVEIMNPTCPTIVVEPLLTLENLKTIQQQVLLIGDQKDALPQKNQQVLRHKVDLLISELNETLSELQNFSRLETDLQQLTQALFHYKKENNPLILQIQDLLQPDDILCHAPALAWEDAIRRVGMILENRCYTKAYTEKMIENVKEYGPYIVISKGVALAHASLKHDVWDEGLSLLVCREGVDFEENQKVHLLFCFCTKGKIDYLEFFQQIIALGKNENKLRRILLETTPGGVFQKLLE